MWDSRHCPSPQDASRPVNSQRQGRPSTMQSWAGNESVPVESICRICWWLALYKSLLSFPLTANRRHAETIFEFRNTTSQRFHGIGTGMDSIEITVNVVSFCRGTWTELIYFYRSSFYWVSIGKTGLPFGVQLLLLLEGSGNLLLISS